MEKLRVLYTYLPTYPFLEGEEQEERDPREVLG